MLRILPLLAAAAILTAGIAHAEAPKVLTTIKPLHALASAVMEGVGKPDLLLRANSSAHTYALRPSDAQAIQRAGLIFWVGPGYESFMAKSIKSLPQTGKVVQLSEAPGVSLLATREGGVWEEHDDGHAGHNHAHGQDHDDDDEKDMHFWLDPQNAKAVLTAMSAALGKADTGNAERYRANAAAAADGIDALDKELAATLAPLKDKHFIVFHDAYQYYERRYGLSAVGSITVTPDRVPGPRRLSELRKKIADQGALCVFSEPQFTSSLVGTVISGTKARGGILDPLGAAAPDGAAGYAGLMRNIADSLKTCLLAAT